MPASIKVLHLVLLLLLLNGCAKPLQPDNYPDLISSARLDDNTFQVSYRDGKADMDEKTIDLSLLRSAEVALANGFNYFVIVPFGATADTDDQVVSEIQISGYEVTTDGNNRYLHTNPGATNTIVCFKERPQGFAYVALFVKASLRAKYGLDQAVEQTAD